MSVSESRSIRPQQGRELDQNPAAVYLAGLGRGSRRAMRHALDVVADLASNGRAGIWDLEWSALRFQHTQAIRSRLTEVYAPATANKTLCALRGVLKSAWRLGLMTAEDYQRAADVAQVPGEALPAGRHIGREELVALRDACLRDPGAAGARDAAIVGLLYTCGLRRSEVVSLDLADYDRESGALAIRRSKRGRERLVHVVNGAASALGDWLAARGLEDGPLFCPVRKGGRLAAGRMSGQAIYNLLKRRASQANLGEDVTIHDFRRTFIGELLDAGADIVTVQQLAGHASPTTTARYDRRPEKVRRRAAELLHFPY